MARFGNRITETIEDTLEETIDTGVASKTGTRLTITEQFDRHSVGDRVVSRDIVPYMRSRNIEFVSKRMKPLTRMYAFFDGEDVTRYCVPKLLEISMNSGTFQVGETIYGRSISTGLGTRPLLAFAALVDVCPAIVISSFFSLIYMTASSLR